ncbi:MAG: hypothetical protein JSR34_07950 [Proteobacteria bacterium]|nr:hypothetical protein [Pseudomonadota bacterium]
MNRHFAILGVSLTIAVVADPTQAAPIVSRACSVAVESGRFTAVFPPIANAGKTWRWQRKDSLADRMEYGWIVDLGRRDRAGTFVADDYGFSTDIFRWESREEEHGTLADLLAAAQYDVFRRVRKPDGQIGMTRQDDLAVQASLRDGTRVVLSSSQHETVTAVFASKPKLAQLSIILPGRYPAYRCMATVVYR